MSTYLLYAVMTREFYEDDNLPASTSEFVVDADNDPDRLRERANQFYAQERQVHSHRGTALFIPPMEFRSNGWRNNGGGCFASGYVEIRVAPMLLLGD